MNIKRRRCCRVSNCSRKDLYGGQGYCSKHHAQLLTYGKILTRTKFDSNEIIYYGEYIGICLYNRNHEKIAEAFVDKKDEELVREHKWHLTKKGYASTHAKKENKYVSKFLHNILVPENEMTDHIDRNKMNNRRSNLRECTNQQNQMNTGKRKDASSGVRGVNWNENVGKWVARIQCNKQRLNLGGFDDFEQAVNVRREAEQKYFKEFAPIM